MEEERKPKQKREEKEFWYAMRATYRRSSAARELLDKENIRCFIPMRYELHLVKGRRVRELVPVVHNLLFVYATSSQIQSVKAKAEYLQYIVNSRSGEKIIVPEDQMLRFIAVAGTYNEQLLWFQSGEVNLAKGSKVRVIGGEFEGLEGVFVKVKGARDRRVVVAIQGVIAVAMATIHPSLIEAIPEEKETTTGKKRKKLF